MPIPLSDRAQVILEEMESAASWNAGAIQMDDSGALCGDELEATADCIATARERLVQLVADLRAQEESER